jgi:ubiquinol-cytochrome c reductase cytochrome c subunit
MRAKASSLAALLGLVIVSAAVAAVAAPTQSSDESPSLEEIAAATSSAVPETDDPEAAAQTLYVQHCSSCHGDDLRGVRDRGPSLQESGAAEAHFYLATGRMPLGDPRAQARRHEPFFDTDDIVLLTWYVAQRSTGGTPIPEVDEDAGDLSRGMRTYLVACAACHQAAGAGGALREGTNAPGLGHATPLEIAEAVRVGPGAMPRFGEGSLSDEQLNDVVRYVRYLDEDLPHPGGFELTGIGPVVEGLIAFVVGLGAMLLFARWIGSRT